MIITNTTKAVKVLKAVGLPNLRLFPGPNMVGEKNIAGYFKDNPAAKALQEECLTVTDPESLSPTEKELAERSRQRNEDLNKAQKVIQANQKQLAKNDVVIEKQAEQLKLQEEQLADQAEQLKQLIKKVDDLTKSKK